jgi:hypothetical protein
MEVETSAAEQAVRDAKDELTDGSDPKRMLRVARREGFVSEIEYATGKDSDWCTDYVDAYIEYLCTLDGDA